MCSREDCQTEEPNLDGKDLFEEISNGEDSIPIKACEEALLSKDETIFLVSHYKDDYFQALIEKLKKTCGDTVCCEDFVCIFNNEESENFEDEVISRARFLFDMIDTNNDGKIEKGELKKFVKTMSKDMNSLSKNLGAYDTDKDKTLDFEEFLKYYTDKEESNRAYKR